MSTSPSEPRQFKVIYCPSPNSPSERAEYNTSGIDDADVLRNHAFQTVPAGSYVVKIIPLN